MNDGTKECWRTEKYRVIKAIFYVGTKSCHLYCKILSDEFNLSDGDSTQQMFTFLKLKALNRENFVWVKLIPHTSSRHRNRYQSWLLRWRLQHVVCWRVGLVSSVRAELISKDFPLSMNKHGPSIIHVNGLAVFSLYDYLVWHAKLGADFRRVKKEIRKICRNSTLYNGATSETTTTLVQ